MTSTESSTSLPLSLLFTLLALCFVLVLAWLIIKFLSKIYSARAADSEIKIRSSYMLGTRQHLYVVNFRDTDYFLGVTSEKIELLDKTLAIHNSDAGNPAINTTENIG